MKFRVFCWFVISVLVPHVVRAQSELPPPKSVEAALASFQTRPDLKIELVAAEPLIVDPVAIDFAPDGRLWVAEMHDYPSGLDGNGKPGGRIKVLSDVDSDGRFDRAELFLEAIPFPTGLMVWRKGVLVCAAPDILYAEDINGDGKADSVKKLFTGFATHNYQARVNSLRWGLDRWIYGSSSLFGGKIKSSMSGKVTDLGQRDFRLDADTGAFEPVHGLSQQGRVRDDWDHWFGCDNSTLLWHFPLPERYLRRNPHIPAPDPRVYPLKEGDPNQLFPISRTLERFNDPHTANRTTSACGLEIYRDDLLGQAYAQNAFVCEPVHNLVHRLILASDGVTFRAHRAQDEKQREFLASTDNWFRPVEVRTGPDGALWIVDMYRFVIEHPRWIPPERLAKLDVRAGDNKGRIYRIVSRQRAGRSVPDLTALRTTQLVEALDTANGTLRDLIQQQLVLKGDPSCTEPLRKLTRQGTNLAARVQALATLVALSACDPGFVSELLDDKTTVMRRFALHAAEPLLRASQERPPGARRAPKLSEKIVAAALATDAELRFQAALTLGEWDDPRIAPPLAQLSLDSNQWVRAAALSSASHQPIAILRSLLARPEALSKSEVVGPLIATAAASDRPGALEELLLTMAPAADGSSAPQLIALANLMTALDRKNLRLEALTNSTNPALRNVLATIQVTLSNILRLAIDTNQSLATRRAAVGLIARNPANAEAGVKFLVQTLQSSTDAGLQLASLESLKRSRGADSGRIILDGWNRFSPATRAAVLNLLPTREEWIAPLLDAVESNVIARTEISAAMSQRLREQGSDETRQRAAALFPVSGSKNRAEQLATFSPVTALTGNPARGEAHFARLCASCHAFGGQGHAVGPDLGAFRDKGVDDFLMAVIEPNAAIEPKFLNYEVQTKDDRSLTGIVRGESATSFQLVQPMGIQETILRETVIEMQASRTSLMPEGLETGLALQDMADLIAYLRR